MHKEKILLYVVTKDGSSLTLQVSYLKFEPRSRIFLNMGSIFSLFITPSHIYTPNKKRLAVVAFTLFYPLLL